MKTHIAINGSAGRMGQRLVHLCHEDPELALTAALEAPGSPHLGRDVGEVCGLGRLGVAVRDALPDERRVEVLVDFSTPQGTMTVLPVCVQRRIPLVVATTGHTAAQKAEIEEAAHDTRPAHGAEHEPVGQRPLPARPPGGRDCWPARISTWRSSSGIIASRRIRRAAPRCTSPASCRRRWARRSCGTAARGWSANGRAARSACTPSASATTSANTPSFSARSARRWS